MLFRKKKSVEKIVPKKTPRKYVAITEETVFSLNTFPKDTRQMLKLLIPAFEEAMKLPPAPDRWLKMLSLLPEEVLLQLNELRETKPKQANHMVVMLSVYARALLYPLDERGVTCAMLDSEVHRASNRIFIYYFPLEYYRRKGYIEPEWAADPFTDWDILRHRYTEAGIAADMELGHFAPAETTKAGDLIEYPATDLSLGNEDESE